MGLGEIGLQLQRPLTGEVGLPEVRFACVEIVVEERAAVSYSGMGQRIVGSISIARLNICRAYSRLFLRS